jgi:GTP-binding protein EngB required for normal cell division
MLCCLLAPVATWYLMRVIYAGFIESNAPNYNRRAALDVSLPLFAVLGATGVGKSSFITTLGGRHVKTNEPPAIGYRLESREFFETIKT